MRKLIAITVLMVCTANNFLFSQTNLALNKRTDASSGYPGHPSSSSNDGNQSTYWAPNGGSFPQWITVDLNYICSLTKITNTFVNNATWYYKIEGSNTNSSQDFHLLVDKTVSGSAGQTITQAISANYRYIKFTITGCSLLSAWASSKELEITGSILSQPSGIVPPIQSVSTGGLLVGSQMCNLWGSKYHWDVLRNAHIYNDRMPLMGWYDEAYDISTDWQIKIAREHGISFFMPCWYRAYDNGGKPVMSQYDHFINSIANTASYRDSMKWAIQWINQKSVSGNICTGVSDFTQNLVPFWIENYFKKPNYLKIYNKPVISIFYASQFVADCGGVENARTAISALRTECVNAGFSGVIILTFYGNKYLEHASTSVQVGDSIGVDFGYAYHLPTFSDLYTTSSPTATQIINWHDTAWSNYNTYSGTPCIASVSMGWDNRPWGGVYGWQLPSSSYSTILQHSKNWANSQPAGTIPNKMVLLDNWNEFGEGHYIFPTNYYGYQYLDAVRNIFYNPGAHSDKLPNILTIPQLGATPPLNLAYKKTVTTSSCFGANYSGDKIVDGSGEYTKWEASDTTFPQWINVDLGTAVSIEKLKVIYGREDIWKYKIEASVDYNTWMPVADHTVAGRKGKILEDMATGVYRYIRITIIKSGNTPASIWELEVYGK